MSNIRWLNEHLLNDAMKAQSYSASNKRQLGSGSSQKPSQPVALTFCSGLDALLVCVTLLPHLAAPSLLGQQGLDHLLLSLQELNEGLT